MIDLGPPDGGAARRAIDQALIAAGLAPVLGDGVDDALAGIPRFEDDETLAAAMADAKQAFGELRCADVVPAAQRALGLLATRQAAGLPVPELPRAWAYVLLCADRTGDVDLARRAADGLRAVGGSPDVPDAVMTKYPAIDSVADRDLVQLDVTTTPPGAAVWVDYARAGTSPVHLVLEAGPHVIAAALAGKRGYVIGTASHHQPSIEIPLTEMTGRWNEVAARIASWQGKVPAASALAAVLAKVDARVAVVRHGDVIEAWGHAGRAEKLVVLGGPDGTRMLGEADKLAALIVDRVRSWSAHLPDPDRPLLVESPAERLRARGRVDEPTKWWVYASIAGAVLAGAVVIYAHDSQSTNQHVELHYP